MSALAQLLNDEGYYVTGSDSNEKYFTEDMLIYKGIEIKEFNSDYVKFARAKGLSENRIMYTHVLRNAIVPLVRSIPAAVIGALLGTYYLESIYAIDGIGATLILANNTKNAPLLQAIVIISAILSIVS